LNLGGRLPRVDGVVKATGAAQYAGDLSLPGMLQGKLLRSPHPHARLLGIDTSRARALPGVRAVVTGQDTLGFKAGGIAAPGNEPYLARDRVRFIGDAVAAVAAVDEDSAEAALEAIEVEYELLPPVLDVQAALAPGAPLVHEDEPGNLSFETNLQFGDVAGAFADCDYVREDDFQTPPIRHGFLEPHAALASWDPSGKLTFWGSKQSPYFTYRNMAKALGIPMSQVRVVQPHLGGGFGGKNEMFNVDFCAALLSIKTGRPVRVVVSQEEVMFAYRQRHPARIHLKSGWNRDGTLVALDADILADGGAYKGIGALSLYLMCTFLGLPYRVPNLRARGRRVYTNTQPSCAMRGHGVPQVRFAAETQLDMAAEELGLDPLEVRLKNAVQPGDVTGHGFKITSCGLTETLLQAQEIVERWRSESPPADNPRLKRGVGLASYGYLCGPRMAGHNTSAALIKVHEDGCVALVTGSSDCGQGSSTVLCQIAAEVLGLGLEDVRYGTLDSEITPLDPGVFGSRVTFITGNAVRLAAEDVRTQLAGVAAGLLQAPVSDVVFRGGKVYALGAPGTALPFARVVKAAQYSGTGMTIMGQGYWAPPDIDLPNFDTGLGNQAGAYSFGTQVAEVEVDTETGRVRVCRMAIAHDCGQPINEMLVEGQLEGSAVGGVGHTFTEIIQRRQGQTMNASFLEYRMPTALDACEVEVLHGDIVDEMGPFGAKESGEGVQVAVMPALVSAVHDAVGVWFREVPITPEVITEALRAGGRTALGTRPGAEAGARPGAEGDARPGAEPGP
jgi:4-hydroxybenzoyl-CoA reductase subunit alpha